MADPNNIREMKEEDFKRVKEIWLSEAKEAHRHISKDFWDSKPVSDTFQKEISNPKHERYVYERNGEILGFITAWTNSPKSSSSYIAELYIVSQYQRQGIGTALFETLQGKNPKFPQLKGRYSRFTSSVYAHNYKSFAWHIKCDFKVRGVMFCPHTGLPKFEMIWEKDRKEGSPGS